MLQAKPNPPASFSTKKELEELLMEGIKGEGTEMTPAEWKRLYDEVEQHAALFRKAS